MNANCYARALDLDLATEHPPPDDVNCCIIKLCIETRPKQNEDDDNRFWLNLSDADELTSGMQIDVVINRNRKKSMYVLTRRCPTSRCGKNYGNRFSFSIYEALAHLRARNRCQGFSGED